MFRNHWVHLSFISDLIKRQLTTYRNIAQAKISLYFHYFRNAAYFGLGLCEPKLGETIVVSCAAGGVGNHVGQIAKIKGIFELNASQ